MNLQHFFGIDFILNKISKVKDLKTLKIYNKKISKERVDKKRGWGKGNYYYL